MGGDSNHAVDHPTEISNQLGLLAAIYDDAIWRFDNDKIAWPEVSKVISMVLYGVRCLDDCDRYNQQNIRGVPKTREVR